MRRIWSRLVNPLNLHRSGAAPVVDGVLLAEIDLARPSTFAARKSSTESANSQLEATAVARTAVIQAKRGIGDVVWHLPFVRAIASASPGGQVTFMAPPSSRAKDLLAAEPSVLQTIYFEHAGSELRRGVNLVRLARLLRQGRFRTVWILDRTLRPAIAAVLARIPERIGLGLGRQSLFITNSGISQSHFHDHPIDWLRALMAEMKVPLPSTEPALNVPKNILAAVDARFHICPRPWIVLGLGASLPNREWPQEHWVAFVAKLRTYGTIFFIGGGDYTARAEQVIAQGNVALAINACNLSLVEAIALLHRADLFVGTDSGPMNLAVAVATPAFALFGVNPVLTYSKFIHPLTPLGGPAPGGMQRISPAHVLEHVELYLSHQKLKQ
jgi:lipopolysaccharide heptosyltransferase II